MSLPSTECTFKIKNYRDLAWKTLLLQVYRYRGLSVIGRIKDMVKYRNPDCFELRSLM